MARRDNEPVIPVKDAVAAATGHLTALVPGAEDIMLEEVEISDDDRYWFVTLSYYQDNPIATKPTGILAGMLPLKQQAYKVFKIDRRTGEVRSMKIREPQDA